MPTTADIHPTKSDTAAAVTATPCNDGFAGNRGSGRAIALAARFAP